ncbi:tetratricopeptide repeat protein 39C-like [Babylonia areolata]|uniref:tetratricopeptide repeat protein 39C-like n=1 Tax=Babylonia areolata TaxID=304850 RepID=UPI003FD28C39
MAEESNAPTNTVDEEECTFDEVETALTGINMLLNNGFDEAVVLFAKYKEESPLMHAGFSFVYFMEALMTFEEDKIGEALRVLQETEKRCEVSDGFVKSVKRKFSKKKRSMEVFRTEEHLQRQVIVADSLLYQAILTFTNQDIGSYVRGGWHLRKAWKIYDKLHTYISRLKESMSLRKISDLKASMAECEGENGSGVDGGLNHGSPDTTMVGDAAGSMELNCRASVEPSKSSPAAERRKGAELSEDTIGRLLGAVNFGYGAFQLCMSMVPPKILRLIEFLGFEGDREVGLACLDYTSHSRDMKAPLATLALLWYHTVLRPFFALDSLNKYSEAAGEPNSKRAGTEEAEAIIREKEAAFPNSCLFLFFRGRIHRLRREADKSYELYMRAFEEARGQREVELMCLYEISWYNLMKLNWDKGAEGFRRLRRESKWSKSYYSYLIGVCEGCQGKVQEAHAVLQAMPYVVKRKNNQIEVFVARRADQLRRCGVTREKCQLLALELIFLWHTLPACSHDDLRRFLLVCEQQTELSVLPLKHLLKGALYRELDEEEKAVECLKECVALHQGRKDDAHVAAFALFELAAIYIKSPLNRRAAKDLLQQIKDNYKDYDFENRLSVRVSNFLRQLKRGGGDGV